jgi:hypothetical protein
MRWLPRSLAELVEPVISAPAPELMRRSALMRRLQIPRTLDGDDVVRFADHIAGNPALAGAMEDMLKKHISLLTPQIAGRLLSIPFLRSRAGGLSKPGRLHIDTRVNRTCLESDDSIVGGSYASLYRRLGCPEQPSSATLIEVIGRLRIRAVPHSRPEVLYPMLVAALRKEKMSSSKHAREPILWVDGAYRTPRAVLVGLPIPRWFRLAVPVFDGPETIQRAYEDLGAGSHPDDNHWRSLFDWFGQKTDTQVVSRSEQTALKAAYQRRGSRGLPDGLPEETRCLLSRDGTLHSLRELHGSTFVEDDYPQLAKALTEKRSKIAFADIVEGSRTFFIALGLGKLTDICAAARDESSPECGPPVWFRPNLKQGTLALLQRSDFASALHELAGLMSAVVTAFTLLG